MFRSFIARLQQPEPAPPWSSWTGLQTALVSFMAVLGGVNVMALLRVQQPFVFLAGYILSGLLALGFVRVTRRTPEDRAALRLGAVTSSSLLLIMFFSFGVALAIDVLRRYQPVPELQYFSGSGLEWALAIVLMVIVQPLAEGIVFRGVLYPALRATFGVWTGIVACALAYAIFHFISYTSRLDANTLWLTFALPYIEGLILTLIRAYTGSTRAAIFGHMAFGMFAVVKLISLGR
jgi:membrane protease YdiL (CAAX protease family)